MSDYRRGARRTDRDLDDCSKGRRDELQIVYFCSERKLDVIGLI